MPAYDRSSDPTLRVIDEYDDAVGWLAYPQEDAQRASHAIRTDDGVWVIDPLDAPGVDDLLSDLGTVAGVTVLSSYHARDADTVANRHGVPVHVPRWIDRVPDRLDAPVERVGGTIGDSGIGVERCTPVPGWTETIATHSPTGTLYVPELLGTADGYLVGDERVGVFVTHRLFPPRDALGGRSPERLLFGHGAGVRTDADAALAAALAGARRGFPQALLRHGTTGVRMIATAIGD